MTEHDITQVVYEYPLNERIRNWLRLEELFRQLAFFAHQQHPLAHHAALNYLFDLLEIGGRSDIKSDLLQELERQRHSINTFRGLPSVSHDTLESMLSEIDQAFQELEAHPGRAGQKLRENEWLMNIQRRNILPQGTCGFDLPSYFAWQHYPASVRQNHLADWIAPFHPLYDVLCLILKMLRGNMTRSQETATSGTFQINIEHKPYQMAQVKPITQEHEVLIPEISADKHALFIRFFSQGADFRMKSFTRPVSFELSFCSLSA